MHHQEYASQTILALYIQSELHPWGAAWGGEGLAAHPQKKQVIASNHKYSILCPFCVSLNKDSVEQTSSLYICYLKIFNAF